MPNRGPQVITPILTVLSMVAISMTVLNYQGFQELGISGQIVSSAWAVEFQTVEKEVGQYVHFKATIKNTGNVNATFLVVAKWREHGTEAWETAGLADARLSPGESEALIVGFIECTETMMGKYFDVMFILWRGETDIVLDEKYIEAAWYVKSIVVGGTISGFWVE